MAALRAYRGPDPHAFVCFAHADWTLVQEQIRWLQDAGINIWFDEGITPGSEWTEEIARAIERASAFVYFVTPNSAESKHCRDELQFAFSTNVPVVGVHLQETELSGGLRLSLGGVQAIHYHALDDAVYRDKLLSTLERYAPGDASADLVAPIAADSSLARRRTLSVAAALVAIVLVGYLIGRDAPTTTQTAQTAPETVAQPVTLDQLNTIAVLPFANLSAADDVGFFAQGLSDGILDELTNTNWLNVASRTASFELANADVGLQLLADQLRVAYVLEGSIQKLGDDVRIIAQLIRASDGFHVWSKTYDRDYRDGLRMQGEIGGNIAQIARSKLTSDTKRRHPELFGELKGIKPEAVRYWLDSEEEYARWTLGEGGSVAKAMTLAEKAVELDPNFVRVHEDMAWNYMWRADPTLSVEESSARAHVAIDRALALDSDSSLALLMLAQIQIDLDLTTPARKRS